MNIFSKVLESSQNWLEVVWNDVLCYLVKFQAPRWSISAVPGCYTKASTWILKIGTWHENILARNLWHENRLEHVDSALFETCSWLETVCPVTRYVSDTNLNICKPQNSWNERNEQKWTFFRKCLNRPKIDWKLSRMMLYGILWSFRHLGGR